MTVHVLYNDYEGLEKVSIRRPSDSALLAAFASGGAFVVQSDDIAPVTVTHDLEYCGWDGSIDDVAPIQLTFTAPDGNSHPLLRGDEATLTGLAGESWGVHLLDAYGGSCCHTDTFVRVALVRNPS